MNNIYRLARSHVANSFIAVAKFLEQGKKAAGVGEVAESY